MKDRLVQWRRRLEAFHNDERGEQNMSSVMLLGVGALVVVALIGIGALIYKFAFGKVRDVVNEQGNPITNGGANP